MIPHPNGITSAFSRQAKFIRNRTNLKVIFHLVDYRQSCLRRALGSRHYVTHIHNGQLNFYIHLKERGWHQRPVIVKEKKYDNQKDFVSAVITEIFNAVPFVREERLEIEERERKYREEHEQRIRKEEMIRLEKSRVKELAENANDFILAKSIRSYVAAVEAKPDLTDEEREWIVWARDKADWIDPTIRKEDPILGKFRTKQDKDVLG